MVHPNFTYLKLWTCAWIWFNRNCNNDFAEFAHVSSCPGELFSPWKEIEFPLHLHVLSSSLCMSMHIDIPYAYIPSFAELLSKNEAERRKALHAFIHFGLDRWLFFSKTSQNAKLRQLLRQEQAIHILHAMLECSCERVDVFPRHLCTWVKTKLLSTPTSNVTHCRRMTVCTGPGTPLYEEDLLSHLAETINLPSGRAMLFQVDPVNLLELMAPCILCFCYPCSYWAHRPNQNTVYCYWFFKQITSSAFDCSCAQSIGFLLRYVIILQVLGETLPNGITVGSWDFECLIQTIFLLHAGADSSQLPLHAPAVVQAQKFFSFDDTSHAYFIPSILSCCISLVCYLLLACSWHKTGNYLVHAPIWYYVVLQSGLEVSSMFLAAASLMHNVGQILGLQSVLPAPCLLFSGRIYAHLHSRTALGAGLLESFRNDLPQNKIKLLKWVSCFIYISELFV